MVSNVDRCPPAGLTFDPGILADDPWRDRGPIRLSFSWASPKEAYADTYVHRFARRPCPADRYRDCRTHLRDRRPATAIPVDEVRCGDDGSAGCRSASRQTAGIIVIGSGRRESRPDHRTGRRYERGTG